MQIRLLVDKIPVQMVLVDDILSPDGQIRVIKRECSSYGWMITLTLAIGNKEGKLHLAYNSKVPIYNYTQGGLISRSMCTYTKGERMKKHKGKKIWKKRGRKRKQIKAGRK